MFDLAIGLPLYLKGHASAWFKSLGNVDGKTFEQMKALMTEHFASRASAWRIRQTLGQRCQLERNLFPNIPIVFVCIVLG